MTCSSGAAAGQPPAGPFSPGYWPATQSWSTTVSPVSSGNQRLGQPEQSHRLRSNSADGLRHPVHIQHIRPRPITHMVTSTNTLATPTPISTTPTDHLQRDALDPCEPADLKKAFWEQGAQPRMTGARAGQDECARSSPRSGAGAVGTSRKQLSEGTTPATPDCGFASPPYYFHRWTEVMPGGCNDPEGVRDRWRGGSVYRARSGHRLFLNVVIWRAGAARASSGLSIDRPCDQGIRARDNIPVVSWATLRGQAATAAPDLPGTPRREL